jgi:outer membrane protein assembly factor BamA
MRTAFKYACLFMGFLFPAAVLQAQPGMSESSLIFSTNGTSGLKDSNALFVIRDIAISGNKKTKANIILRELSFTIGEEYPLNVIAENFRTARRQLMNTGLFHEVVVSLKSLSGYDVSVNVEVIEKWYIWPKVFIRPVDKTFGQWWNEKHRSMDRINYGLRLSHNNITGRNDKLRISLMDGYTRQMSFQYYGLRLDRDLKWSTNLGVSFGKNKEVNYMTLNNKQVPLNNSDQYLRSYFNAFLQFNYRPAIKTTHTFGIGYTYENIADTIFKLNPYFSSKPNVVCYPELAYKLSYFDVDFIPYPTKGFMGEFSFRKMGFSGPVNLWEITAKASRSWPVGPKYFFNLKGVGMLKLPFDQPYITRQFIGYDGKYLQGYEYYVIDGVAGGYVKASIARPVLNTHISIPSQRLKLLNYIPIKLYAKTFVNAGYAYNKWPGQNQLANKMLYSGGVGFDLITCTDFVIKFEWSFNRLGDNGLYLHQRNDF